MMVDREGWEDGRSKGQLETKLEDKSWIIKKLMKGWCKKRLKKKIREAKGSKKVFKDYKWKTNEMIYRILKKRIKENENKESLKNHIIELIRKKRHWLFEIWAK